MGLGLQGMNAVLAAPTRPIPTGTSFAVRDGVINHVHS